MSENYVVTFNISGHDASTLQPSDIGVHPDGWTIEGEVHEDYYEWVNDFSATKGDWKVWGNFEKTVYASSQEAYDDFVTNHSPIDWDYWDI